MAGLQVFILCAAIFMAVSGSHMQGGTISFKATEKTQTGWLVDFIYKTSFIDNYGDSLYWNCFTGDCGYEINRWIEPVENRTWSPGRWFQYEGHIRRRVDNDKPFQLWESSCCWVYNIYNVNGWQLTASVDLGIRSDTLTPNSSPVTTIIPILRIPQNCATTINLLRHDPDGDFVSCRYGNYYDECSSCSWSFSVDESRCTVSVPSSMSSGSYVMELILEDFPKNGIYLTYKDGTTVYKYPNFHRKKRELSKDSQKYYWYWPSTYTAESDYTSYGDSLWTTGSVTDVTSSDVIWDTSVDVSVTPEYYTTDHPSVDVSTYEESTLHTVTVAETSPETVTEATPETMSVAETSPETVTEATPETMTVAETSPETVTEATPETMTVAETSPETVTEATPETMTVAETSPETVTEATPETMSVAETSPETVTEATPETMTVAETSPETVTEATPETMSVAETSPETVTEATPETMTVAETSPETVTEATPETMTVAETSPETVTEVTPETMTESVTLSVTDILTSPYVTTDTYYPSYQTPTMNSLSKISLQFLVEVTSSAPSCTFGDYRPKFVPPTPNHGEKLLTNAGSAIQLHLSAQAAYESISDFLVSGPPGIRKSFTGSSRSTTRSMVAEWTPSENNVGDHIPLCFVAETYGGYQSEMRCVIAVVGPSHLDNMELTCHENTMTLIVGKSSDHELYENQFRLNDPQCLVSSNSTHLIASVAYNSCGTETEETEDDIVFKNQATSFSDQLSVITRLHGVSIPFNCSFPKKSRVSASFRAHKSDYVFTEAGFGKFTYKFQFFTDDRFAEVETQYPLEATLRELLYMEIQVSASVPNVQLFVESCKATPHDNPTDPTFYHLIQNGCIKDDTLVVYSENRTDYRFAVEAFAFIGDYSEVYISCTVILCKLGESGTRCSQGCITKSLGGANRHRRSVTAESQQHFISQGPLRMKRQSPSDGDHDASASLNVNTLVISISGAAVVALLGFIVYVYAKRVRFSGYNLLKTQDF
ncbi:uncharacterized protein [Phyllobates terribilis]|uniref:uncharacterized protein n=1 Tax=Phyllobates terribilis TaxID=111132 RepID=UPI003CCB30AC